LEKWNSISESDHDYLSLEEIAVAAGLSPRRLWEVLAGACLQQSADTVKLMVSAAQPKIVDATIKAATEEKPILDNQGEIIGHTYGDIRAQETIYRITGLMPTPKGSTLSINLQQNNGKPDD